MTEFIGLSLEARRYCRTMSGLLPRDNRPVMIERGNRAPKVIGRSYYHTNKSGQIIHHPNAYGYSTIYHHSTVRVVVGHRWLYRRGMLTMGPTLR